VSRPSSRRALRAAAGAVAAVCLTVLAGCGSSGSSSGTTAGSSPSASPSPSEASGPAGSEASAAPVAPGALTVFAAASLRATFTEIGEIFQQQTPGSTVTFNFAGSSDLVTQITAGAPADVFASADENNMNKAVTAEVLEGEPVNFASNILTIVTQPGNPKGITGFADLAKTDLQVVICAPQVPCGSATKQVEANTGVTLTPVSEESSVTDVLNKVQTGQADAGLVYVTDAKNAGDKVTEVPFAEAAAVVNVYPIAALTAATQPELATTFVELVTGPDGQQVLKEAGFQPAP
jgi:molybdate transport system substrate-binding protein